MIEICNISTIKTFLTDCYWFYLVKKILLLLLILLLTQKWSGQSREGKTFMTTWSSEFENGLNSAIFLVKMDVAGATQSVPRMHWDN